MHETAEPTREALSVAEAARVANISRATLYKLLAAGEGPATLKVGERRLIRLEAMRKVESYLPEVFDLVVATGRRISAVCGLRVEDIDLEPTAEAPFGGIVWPADTDKMEKRWRCPLSKAGREAVEAMNGRANRRGRGAF